jgi:hypothetical protein
MHSNVRHVLHMRYSACISHQIAWQRVGCVTANLDTDIAGVKRLTGCLQCNISRFSLKYVIVLLMLRSSSAQSPTQLSHSFTVVNEYAFTSSSNLMHDKKSLLVHHGISLKEI